ncbi:MAG: hypothetical protein ACYC9Y_01390 [Candidatus Methylomirabilia bacterium]
MSANEEGAVFGGFTAEEERLHEAGFAAIRSGLAAGLDFEKACAGIEAADADLRRIIVDDFLKVTIAQRNFQGGESTTDIAATLGISVERVEFARREMLAEVAAASVDVFRRQGGEVPDA